MTAIQLLTCVLAKGAAGGAGGGTGIQAYSRLSAIACASNPGSQLCVVPEFSSSVLSTVF